MLPTKLESCESNHKYSSTYAASRFFGKHKRLFVDKILDLANMRRIIDVFFFTGLIVYVQAISSNKKGLT